MKKVIISIISSLLSLNISKEPRAAASGQLHAVEGKLKPLAIVCHRLVQYVSVCKCSETLVHCDFGVLLI